MPSSTPPLPENHPLTMASLQQSARDILRGFENAMASTPITASSNRSPKTRSRSPAGNNSKEAVASFEQAFRSFFTSCTQGAAMATTDEDDDGSLNPVEVAMSTSSDCSIFSTPRSTPQRVSSTNDGLRQLAANSKPLNGASEQHEQKIAADHIYEHLFFAEEQARRAATQTNLNVSSSQQPSTFSSPTKIEVSPANSFGMAPSGIHRRRMTQPFPMSAPTPRDAPELRRHSTPMTSSLIVSQNRTFDDDISAISAHTLEAMVTPSKEALSEQPTRSAAVLVTPSKTEAPALPLKRNNFCRASTLPRANYGPRDDVEAPPPIISRDSSSSGGRSHGNQSSVRKFHRTHSLSPNSSGTQSFDRWQSVEQEFWDSVVAEDDALLPVKPFHRKGHGRRRSIDGWSGSRSRTADSTLSGGSLSQRSSSWLALHPQNHPHETFPYSFPNDDDLYLQQAPYNHRSFHDLTESAEI